MADTTLQDQKLGHEDHNKECASLKEQHVREKDTLKRRIQAIEKESLELSKQLVRVSRERDDYSEQLRIIKGSSSWRLTYPIRACVRPIKMLFGQENEVLPVFDLFRRTPAAVIRRLWLLARRNSVVVRAAEQIKSRAPTVYKLFARANRGYKSTFNREIISFDNLDVLQSLLDEVPLTQDLEKGEAKRARSIWLDITTLLNWGRPAVGIVRVESEVGKYFSNQKNSSVRFCVYYRESGKYVELSENQAALVIAQDQEALLRVREEFLEVSKSQAFRTPFMELDAYISIGLDWDQKDMDLIYRLHSELSIFTVLCCYDIIPVKFPHLCVGDVAERFSEYFYKLIWSADLVLCISKCTESDLRWLAADMHGPKPKTAVIRLGSDIRVGCQDECGGIVLELAGRDFILFVSTIERRKNHEIVYRAYTRLLDMGKKDLPLFVMVGMPGWGVQNFMDDLKFDERIQPYIRILNHVSDSELSLLYSHCLFTVYPSLYEGWGLPVAESLGYGKFCLASNAASVPEVGGDLLEYIDPWDLPAWTERLLYYIEDRVALTQREENIVANFHAPTWAELGRDVYQLVAEGEANSSANGEVSI